METTPMTIDEQLLDLVRDHRNHFWVGEYPPFDFVSGNLMDCASLRLSPSHHQSYDVVWFYEQNMASLPPGKYELVLDELVRLIGDEGKLVVRYSQNLDFTVMRLKNFLGRRLNARVSVDAEWAERGMITTVFHVERMQLDKYSRDDWTFALLSQGTRIDNVLAFLKSVRDHDPEYRHEIIICGPENEEAYGKYGVRYMTEAPDKSRPYRNQLAEISRKKNDIAEAATSANLLIAHDRYRLDENFFSGFRQFGYDFDFVSTIQWYECGARFPAYVVMEGPPLSWRTPLDCDDYEFLAPTCYLNGGFLIAKTHSLRSVRFNEMLFWNQAEDLELSQAFRDHGLPPRMNCFSSATTLGITKEYTSAFGKYSHPVPSRQKTIVNSLRNSGRKFEQRIRGMIRTFGRSAAS